MTTATARLTATATRKNRRADAMAARLALPLLAALALSGCNAGLGETFSAGAGKGEACRSATELSDADDSLSGFGSVCATETRFEERGAVWRVHTFDSGRPGPLFVLPHDDEDAALSTAAWALGRYGGVATAVESGGSRFVGGIDPNRNFDADALDCRRPGGRSPRFVSAMLGPGNRPVIALHTNARGAAATGGTGSVSIRAPYDGAEAFPSPSAAGGRASEDAMVILASRTGARDRRARSLVEKLNAAGVHVLVETVDPARTDCSLSHYAVVNGIPYANVEAADGDGATQREILDILMRSL